MFWTPPGGGAAAPPRVVSPGRADLASRASSEPTVPTYSTPPGGGAEAAAPWHLRRPAAPRPVSPEPARLTSRAAAAAGPNDDRLATSARSSATIVASQREKRALARNARSLSPMVQRKDYKIPKNSTSKKPLSDGIHPEKYLMKKERKLHSVAGATSGAFVGGLLTGPAFPVGVVLGAAAGGYASNKMHKMQERRRQRRHEQRNFQKAAKQTVVAKSDSIVYV